ncbi:plastid movement impaired protein [Rhynchospora pubera]|uniref:Plastid movement impaired protein n=1 Tax=Rhynchospora pubera TaxID=906938 RepID=A0AAV8H4H2_9POAL|nr:plastid movement impaired protein [Rhynchospora pubera]
MGNSLSLKKRTAKIMKIDGTSFRLKPPSQASHALRDHPGYSLLESDEVKRLGLRAKPLDPDAPLKPGKLYFLVEIPNVGNRNNPRGAGRSWSGQINLGAKERLESLMLSRRSMSDVCLTKPSVEAKGDGSVRLRMKLPKAQVEKLMEESKSAAEAAEKIMKLCAAKDRGLAPTAVVPENRLVLPKVSSVPATPGKKEKRTRFMDVPDEIIML